MKSVLVLDDELVGIVVQRRLRLLTVTLLFVVLATLSISYYLKIREGYPPDITWKQTSVKNDKDFLCLFTTFKPDDSKLQVCHQSALFRIHRRACGTPTLRPDIGPNLQPVSDVPTRVNLPNK